MDPGLVRGGGPVGLWPAGIERTRVGRTHLLAPLSRVGESWGDSDFLCVRVPPFAMNLPLLDAESQSRVLEWVIGLLALCVILFVLWFMRLMNSLTAGGPQSSEDDCPDWPTRKKQPPFRSEEREPWEL